MKKIKETPKIKIVLDCLVQADDLSQRERSWRELSCHSTTSAARCAASASTTQ